MVTEAAMQQVKEPQAMLVRERQRYVIDEKVRITGRRTRSESSAKEFYSEFKQLSH